MRLDHVSFAARPAGLDATADELGARLGVRFDDGGFHPQFGTRNKILPLAGGHYLEVVAVLDHPAAEKVPFGQAVRARSLAGGGWMAWAVSVDDLAPVENRLGRPPLEARRHRPDGVQLRWLQLGVLGLQSDPQLPFFVKWLSDPAVHPSVGGGRVRLKELEIAGDHGRIDDWLGGRSAEALDDVDIECTTPAGTPGIASALFTTPWGEVRI